MRQRCKRKSRKRGFESHLRIRNIALYIQMEAAECTLEDFLNENPCSSLTKAEFDHRMQMGYQIIRGVNVLHESYKLIHRNLSLSSIHITSDGTLKLGELGRVAESSEVFEDTFNSRVFKRHLSYQTFPNPHAKLCPLKAAAGKSGAQLSSDRRLFAAPEQGVKRTDSQKADIYSLGLILLALLCPSVGEKERADAVKECKVKGPPSAFAKDHKEIAKLIDQMVSIETSVRPSIKAILGHSAFREHGMQKPKSSDSLVVPEEHNKALKGEFRLMLGKSNKWKRRYLRVDGKKLLIFKRKEDAKARINYPLLECVIHTKNNAHRRNRKLLSKRSQSLCSIDEARTTETANVVTTVVIEHPEIVTVTVELVGTKEECADWLLYLRSSPLA